MEIAVLLTACVLIGLQTSYKLVNMNSEQHTTAKVWLITGASRGMGHAIMEAALAAGHCVAAVSRSGEITTHIEDGAAQLLPYALDVTNTEQAVFDRMAEAVVKRFGRIDVLVNNAGHGQFTYFEESDEQQIRDVFETNLFGLMRVTRAVLPVMRRQHAGHIFNISSAAGYSGVGPSIYHTSKFAVTGFSESLAFETEQFGIRVTIVAPGLFRTDFMNFNSAYHLPARPIADYDAFRERMSGFVKYMNGREPGNPEVLGRLVVKAADSENPPLHLPVGADAIETLETHHEAQRRMSRHGVRCPAPPRSLPKSRKSIRRRFSMNRSMRGGKSEGMKSRMPDLQNTNRSCLKFSCRIG